VTARADERAAQAQQRAARQVRANEAALKAANALAKAKEEHANIMKVVQRARQMAEEASTQEAVALAAVTTAKQQVTLARNAAAVCNPDQAEDALQHSLNAMRVVARRSALWPPVESLLHCKTSAPHSISSNCLRLSLPGAAPCSARATLPSVGNCLSLCHHTHPTRNIFSRRDSGVNAAVQ
jgi:hypothetical protein